MRSAVLSLLLRRPTVREPLRRRTRALFAWALRRRSRPYVPAPGPALLIAPHPDDSALGCGGWALLRRLEGLDVHVLCLTDGSASHAGHPRMPPAELARQRRAEEERAARRLGIDRAALHFLELPDGELNRLSAGARQSARAAVRALLERLEPAEVVLPCRADGSTEHEAGFLLVRNAMQGLPGAPRVLEYPIWAWWSPLRLAAPLLRARRVWRVSLSGYEEIKRLAITEHGSQVEATAPWAEPVLPAEFVAAFAGTEEYLFEMEPACAGS